MNPWDLEACIHIIHEQWIQFYYSLCLYTSINVHVCVYTCGYLHLEPEVDLRCVCTSQLLPTMAFISFLFRHGVSLSLLTSWRVCMKILLPPPFQIQRLKTGPQNTWLLNESWGFELDFSWLCRKHIPSL